MLLVEYTLLDNLQVINENTAGGATKLKLRGRFQKCDEQNNNGRTYPRKILEGQVKKIQEKIGDRSLVGALDHPANDAIHLSQASHLITGLSVDKSGDVIGECEILSTPNGKIVKSLINDGVKIGISSRGVGSVSEGPAGKVVNEDFKLITFDLVSDPSTKGAFPELTESIRENSQRAQAIISKHKRDRVLVTMLESKVNQKLKEALTESEKKKAANRARSLASAATAGIGPNAVNPAMSDAEAEKVRKKVDPLRLAAEADRRLSGPKKKAAKKKAKARVDREDSSINFIPIAGTIHSKGDRPVTAAEQKNAEKRASERFPDLKKAKKKKAKKKGKSVNDIVVEALKKVCWGDRYDEGKIKNDPKAFLAAQEADRAHTAKVKKFSNMTPEQISNLHPEEGNQRARLIRMGHITPAKPKKK